MLVRRIGVQRPGITDSGNPAVAQDRDLIGGLTIRIGDTVIDGSVQGYLASLREQLLG